MKLNNQNWLTFFIIQCFLIGNANAECRTDIRHSASNDRYTIQSNGTEVLDNQTKLIWQRCSIGQTWSGNICTGSANMYTWKNALSTAKAVGTNYRLPNIKELQSLREVACSTPSINSQIFPNTMADNYWSASPYMLNDDYAWYVHFGDGGSNDYLKSSGSYVRAVRSNK